MSDSFFVGLNIHQPDINLEDGFGMHSTFPPLWEYSTGSRIVKKLVSVSTS